MRQIVPRVLCPKIQVLIDLEDLCFKYETIYNDGACLRGPNSDHLPFYTNVHNDCVNYLN